MVHQSWKWTIVFVLLLVLSPKAAFCQCDHNHDEAEIEISEWHDDDHNHHSSPSHDHGHVHVHKHDDSEANSPHNHQGEDSSGILRQPEELAEELELLEHGFYSEGEEEPVQLIHGMTLSGLWFRAMGSSFIVSLVSLVCLSILPFISDRGGLPSPEVVDGLAAFGVGAMLGDAFLHQLPHAFAGSNHNHDHGHGSHGHGLAQLSVGISVLSGLLLFFVVEKLVRAIESSSSSRSSHRHGHSHSHVHVIKESEEHSEKDSNKKEEEIEAVAAESDDTKAVKDEPAVESDGKKVKEPEKENAESEKGEEKEEVDTEVDVKTAGDSEEKETESAVTKQEEAPVVVPSEEGKTGLRRRKKAEPSTEEASEAVADKADADEAAADKAVADEADDAKEQVQEGEQVKEEVHEGKEDNKRDGVDGTEAGGAKNPLKILGYLNLFSDGVHNFTDGMSLGVAFVSHGSVGGWSRLLFMLAHELPQEVGDFGILVQSGFSVASALALNFLSALTAMAGTALALLVRKNAVNSSLIEGFTAGGFIYICLAGVMPDMHSKGSDLRTSTRQLGAMLLGISVALVISLLE